MIIMHTRLQALWKKVDGIIMINPRGSNPEND